MRNWLNFTTILGLLLAPMVNADDNEKLLGSFRDWSSMHYEANNARVCVTWTDPTQSSGSNREQKPHAFVSHRPGARAFHEVSIQVGTPLRAGSVLIAMVGEQRFTLYSDGDSAWNNSLKEDLRLIRAMRAGRSVTITATAADGAQIRDSYSLFGFTAAHRVINEACKAKY
jgi:hypothetical protein